MRHKHQVTSSYVPEAHPAAPLTPVPAGGLGTLPLPPAVAVLHSLSVRPQYNKFQTRPHGRLPYAPGALPTTAHHQLCSNHPHFAGRQAAAHGAAYGKPAHKGAAAKTPLLFSPVPRSSMSGSLVHGHRQGLERARAKFEALTSRPQALLARAYDLARWRLGSGISGTAMPLWGPGLGGPPGTTA